MAEKDSNGGKKPDDSKDAGQKKINLKDMKELLNNMSLSQATSSKTLDQGEHKFWGTQPVPWKEKAEEVKPKKVEEGPIDPNTDPDKVSADPSPLIEGFEWVTMDMTSKTDVEDVHSLLYNNYVEDAEAMFRLNYSHSFLNWSLKSPGWVADWHIGIRASQSKKLVAFISGVPVTLRVRDANIRACEVNFMCVHKKLRSKRLAPVLIREITRRCNRIGVWQAIYTAGALVHPPVAICRYYHRSLDWAKLHDVGFSPMPPNSTKQRQIIKYKLPEKTSIKGLRPMKQSDAPAVKDLLTRYLSSRSKMAQHFDDKETAHWLLNSDTDSADKVVWSYVVENEAGKVTDFFSFYELQSTVIGHAKHSNIRAAYLFYYATETLFSGGEAELKARLNELMHDALILAKQEGFDVFNALSLLDNPLFLAEQKFGPGDGRLHYYLYNYRTAPMDGGLDAAFHLDTKKLGGIGVVML